MKVCVTTVNGTKFSLSHAGYAGELSAVMKIFSNMISRGEIVLFWDDIEILKRFLDENFYNLMDEVKKKHFSLYSMY